MSRLANAARAAVAIQSRIPVAPEEKRRLPPPPVASQAQSRDLRRRLPTGAKQASLSSPPRLLAAVPFAAFRSQAVGAFGEARVMVWVRRFSCDGNLVGNAPGVDDRDGDLQAVEDAYRAALAGTAPELLKKLRTANSSCLLKTCSIC